jgi:hypothetical protein
MVFSFLLVAYVNANDRIFDVYRVGSIPFQQSQYSRTKAILIQLKDFNHGMQVAHTLDNAGWRWVGRPAYKNASVRWGKEAAKRVGARK